MGKCPLEGYPSHPPPPARASADIPRGQCAHAGRGREIQTRNWDAENGGSIIEDGSVRLGYSRNPHSVLKVVGNEKEWGSGRCQTFTILYVSAAIDVLFSLNFAVVFDFIYFHFRPRKAKSIGDVLTNRQNVAHCCLYRVKEIC